MNLVLFLGVCPFRTGRGRDFSKNSACPGYTYQVAMQEIPTKTLPVAELETERLQLSDLSSDTDQIINGDCLDIMQNMADESIDCIVTDPPYGISFMGKNWDKALPSVEIWKECLRVMKPGAFAFVMCIPRQDCLSRMIINLEDAGFMVNFSPILWTYATGFPKAANIGKLVDKRLGVEREVVGRYRSPDGCDRNWESNSVNREVYGWSSQEQGTNTRNITAPATPEAKALDGSYAGYQPKPAVEIVLVVMKPLSEKTYLDQALANGKGITWLDSGRIPYQSDDVYNKIGIRSPSNRASTNFGQAKGQEDDWVQYPANPQGRFAPNLLVSDDVLNDGKVTRSRAGGYDWRDSKNDNPTHIIAHNIKSGIHYGDSGSYSRYFSLDAWSDKYLPDSVNRVFPFLIVPKASKSEKNAGLDELEDKEMYYKDGRGNSLEIKCNPEFRASRGRKPPEPRKNIHPTCKPIKLMSYLVMIGSRPGDVILDSFCGSGTTCIAAAILDRRYIGIELDEEMCDISDRRIAWHVEEAAEESGRQPDLFAEAAGD